jgi:1,4-dihydroxy-2-naphthoate octaprenyltransferase
MLYFNPAAFIDNLSYMGVGMIGVFMIVGVIMVATYLIPRITSKLGSKGDNE